MPKPIRAGDRLPYASLANDHTIVLRDGSLLQCLHVEGLGFETAETSELNHKHAGREAALRAIGQSRFVLSHHIVRRRIHVDLPGVYEDPICAEIDRRWRERLTERVLFVNDLFVSILRRPSKGRAGIAERAAWALSRSTEDARAARARQIQDLDAARDMLCAALQPYGARLLSGYTTAHGSCSEPLEFLSAIYNGELRPMLTPKGDIGQHLPYRRISFGHDALELAGPGDARTYAAVLALKEYPTHATPGMLDALLRLPCEMVIAQRFAFSERQTALEAVSLAIRRFRAADEDSITLKRGLAAAKDEIASGMCALGEHSMNILVRSTSLDGLGAATAECSAALADIGAVAVREDICLEAAFWSQFPGNESYAPRVAKLTTSAFAGCMSLHGHPLGQPTENHWGAALTVVETTASTPYFLNLHRGDLGNFTIIGPSGSGKTVVLNFLIAQAQKFKPRTIVFDKDRGSEIFVRAIGGHYASLRSGEPTGFNPLQLADGPSTRAFLRQWLVRLLTQPGEKPRPSDEALVAAAIAANFDQPPEYRRLRYLRELLGGAQRPGPDDPATRLAPWCDTGEFAWMFDNAVDRVDVSQQVVGFDLTELLDDQRLRSPAMMYLFHRIEQRLNGEPTLIVIDEGWKALDDPVFATRIRDWMKTLRKRNAALGFGTQSARYALDSSVSAAIIEQAATQIFMPNSRATSEDYCAGFGLTEHELALVRSLPSHAHCFLLRHAGHSVVARLDLSFMPEILTALSGREQSTRQLDALRAEFGDAPEAWWEQLTGSHYPGKSTLMPPPTRLKVRA